MPLSRNPDSEASRAQDITRSARVPDLNLLRTFDAVCRLGSLTAAARELGLSQSTVTAHVQGLEQQRGEPLLTRLSRGVAPTLAGLDLAGRISASLEMLEGAMQDSPENPRRIPVRLAGPSELLCTRILPALAPWVAQGLELRVQQGLTDPLVEQLWAGQQDLVITTRRPRGRAARTVALVDEEYVLVASPSWAQAVAGRGGSGGLAEALETVPLVSYAEDLPLIRRYWRNVLERERPERPAGLTVPNLHAVVAAVAAGAGCSVLPRSLCAEHLLAGRLVELVSPEVPPLNTLFLMQRPGSDALPDVVQVRDALVSAAASWTKR